MVATSEMPVGGTAWNTSWGDRLEVSTEVVLQRHGDEDTMAAWVHKLSPRARDLLIERLGIGLDDGAGLKDTRAAILERKGELLDFLLVDAAAQGKRSFAIVEVGRAQLSEEDFEACRIKEGEEKFDRRVLMWRLFLADPENLELVFHLDRTQRKGFARMVLPSLPEPGDTAPEDFFRCEAIQPYLDDFEKGKTPQRNSYCAKVMTSDDGYQVFIKRDNKPSFVSHGAKNTFGYDREWIILEFRSDLGRVRICSVSPKVPLLIANRLASAFFGKEVGYENASAETSRDQVLDFLQALVDKPEHLPLVEVVVRNSGLAGSPQIRLNNQDNRSLAPALSQFGASYNDILEDPEDIESLKVAVFDKRVKIVFEKLDDDGDSFVVRYADQPLNGKQRRAFEEQMLDDYGITVLSTEKRHA